MNLLELQENVENACESLESRDRGKLLELFAEFRKHLNAGAIRAALKTEDSWQVVPWIKKGILLGFKLGELSDCSINEEFRFFDKHTYPLKSLTLADKVRQVPGGSSIRDGCFVAPGVVIMPPAYINVGAYVDSDSMVDSHALVGSCAQIGKNVHLSAGAQIGGVLEPIGAMPVIIEDDVLIGGNCGIFDGTLVKSGAVIAAGTILTGSTQIYDLVRDEIHTKTNDSPLIVPAGAVVVPGSRQVDKPFAKQHGLSLYTPIIVKYRDEKTDSVTALENALR